MIASTARSARCSTSSIATWARRNYLVGLSSDHGVRRCRTRQAQGFDAGRISTVAVGAPSMKCWRELARSYRTRVIHNDIYFNDGVYLKLTQNARRWPRCWTQSARRRACGVCIARGRAVGDRSVDAPSAFSHYEGRSGDIKMLGRSYWIVLEHEHARHRPPP
jgi:hypothetical protein